MRSSLLLAAPLGVCLCLGSLQAQSIVDPAYAKGVEAVTGDYRPFGSVSSGGWRYLQIHDGLMGKKATINQLAWRRDVNRGRYSAFSFRLTLILSTAKVSYDKIDTTFDNNHGTNKQTVVNFQEIKWPATAPSRTASPFEYVVKLSKPYAFDGTSGGLCWEAQVTNQQTIRTTVYFDAVSSSSTNPRMQTQVYGSGCYHSTEINPMSATGTSSMNWNGKTGTMYLDGRYLQRNNVAIGLFGFSRTQYAVFQLPFMFPGSQNGYSGACYLYTGLDLVIPTTANNSGNTRITFPVPATDALNGQRIYGQILSLDTNSSSAIPLTSTNGVEYQWVKPYGVPMMSRLYASNNFSTTGSKSVNYGLVTGAQ